eukprot:scaffold154897_cov52-Attheya_sp.AAC.1
MRLVPAVGTLVSFLKSNVSHQICPLFCAEFIAFISIRIDSIDASRPCGSNAGICIEFGRLIVEI